MKTASSRFLKGSVAILFLLVALSLAPRASADIFKIEDGSTCHNLTQAVANCNGSSAWLLTDLLKQLSAPNIIGSLGEGTDVFLVQNNIGNSFSFQLASTGQNGTGVANNGSCQLSSSLFNACSIVDSTGDSTSLGATQINGLTFPATITFSGPTDLGKTFYLEFISMQGTSNVVPTPEPATITLLGLGIFSLLGVRRRRARS